MGNRPLFYYVDDEEQLAEIVELVFEDEDLDCKIFTNPEDCLLAVINKAPDVLITDFKMPQMTGLELLEKVKNLESSSHIKTAILSGFLTAEIEKNAEGLKVDAIFNKPLDNDKLVISVFELAKKRK